MAEYDNSLVDDIEISYTNVVLNNSPNYKTSFSLNGYPVSMEVGYSDRLNKRWIIIEDRSGTLFLRQTTIDYGRRVELNFNSKQADLDYYVTLRPIDEFKNIPSDYDYINWGNDFVLCFVGKPYSFTERANQNLRVALVGN